MRTGARAAAALTLAFGLLLAACGDEGDDTEDGPAEAGACPFDAATISEATGWDLQQVDPEGAVAVTDVRCTFEDGNDSVTVSDLPDGSELRQVADRFESSAASSYEELPALGDGAFVVFLETSSTPESDDVIYQADLYSQDGDDVLVVSLLGFSTEDDRDAAVEATAALLAG